MKIAGNIADNSRKKHHQLSISIQAKRYEQVKNLRDVFDNHGMTFETRLESCAEREIPTVKVSGKFVYREMPSGKFQESLYPSGIHNIITNEEVSKETQKDLLSVDIHGKNEYIKFIRERLSSSASISVWEPIKRLNLKVFSTPRKEKNKVKSEIITVKEHRALFARCAMLVNSERGVDMEYVISSLELGYPRSLMTLSGDLHPGHAGKAQLTHVLKELTIMDREEEFLHEQMIYY